MSDKTGIEWTDATWNPVTGCTEVTPGCDHCYAKTFAERWRGTPGHYFENGFDVQLRPDKLNLPLTWKKPKKVFVNSMSDLFHDQVEASYIAEVFAVMAAAPQHTFQVLTKRHARMRYLLNLENLFRSEVERIALDQHGVLDVPWPLPNVWLGVSAENQQWADIRIPALLATPAAVRFVSAEPLLGPIDLRQHLEFECPVCYRKAPWTDGRVAGYDGSDINEYWCQTCGNETDLAACAPQLHWVIVGGESGRGARPMHPDWARSVRDQCEASGVAFLFKQWGEYRPGQPGVDTWDQLEVFPARLDVPMAPGVDLGPLAEMRRVGKKAAGRELDGRTWDEYPQPLGVAS